MHSNAETMRACARYRLGPSGYPYRVLTAFKQRSFWGKALFMLGVLIVIGLSLLGGIGIALGMVNMGG